MDRRSFLRLGASGIAACACGCATSRPRLTSHVAIREDFIPDGKFGRHIHIPLSPTFVTVHSTGSPGGTAAVHARLLREGQIRATSQWNKRGFNIWHFTVDDREVIQHMPLNEAGEHADHDGPGNATSIGIEICEFHESDRQKRALDRAAELVSDVRRQFRIGIDHVVPHYYWTMHRFNNWHKPCPAILMDDGKPGAKWDAFRNRC
jgi:N-acetylmuramoyl-L-alanine amidase